MNQQKIGTFFKQLRNEKGLTQEQFAEIFHVSSRTVSRWENGYNMPDLDIMIEISDYYEIDLRELLDGERKGGNMNKEMEETVLKAADYANDQAERYTRRVHSLLIVGAIFWIVSLLISHTGLAQNSIAAIIAEFSSGAAGGALICSAAIRIRCHRQKIWAFKQRLLERQ